MPLKEELSVYVEVKTESPLDRLLQAPVVLPDIEASMTAVVVCRCGYENCFQSKTVIGYRDKSGRLYDTNRNPVDSLEGLNT